MKSGGINVLLGFVQTKKTIDDRKKQYNPDNNVQIGILKIGKGDDQDPNQRTRPEHIHQYGEDFTHRPLFFVEDWYIP